MKYPITINLIEGLPKIPFRNGVGKFEGVVAHSTDDLNATDEAIRKYEATHYQNAFVHYCIDWDSITQLADTNYIAYGAGYIANQRYVHVELCETANPALFLESYKRYTWLLAYILFQRKLGVFAENTFWTHDMVRKVLGDTTHTDPVSYLGTHGVSIDKLLADVTSEYNTLAVPPKPKKQFLTLPKSADSWRVYKLDDAPVKGNECGFLNPKKFGGLTYEILANPQKDVYVIQTDNFGKVQIFANSSLGVTFTNI